MLPTVAAPDMSLDRLVRKVPRLALPLVPPSRLTRFWKLDSRFVSVLVLESVVALAEVPLAPDDASAWIRFCRSVFRPVFAESVAADEDTAAEPLDDLFASPSQLPPVLVPCAPVLCECSAASRLCMKLASAWPTSPDESVDADDADALVAELPVVLALPVAPICDNARMTDCSRPPAGGEGVGVPPSASRLVAPVDVELLSCAAAS